MLSTILAKIGIPVLVRVLAETLGTVDNPVTKSAEKALKDVYKTLENGGINPDQMQAAHRHLEKIAELESQENAAILSEINETIRAEAASNDPYVRRMRPTFGYLMALTWAAQMFGLAYVIIFETENAPLVLNAMGLLGAIWAVGLSFTFTSAARIKSYFTHLKRRYAGAGRA